jgi:RNA polymerase sigma-70 factor (ECF subfamily)
MKKGDEMKIRVIFYLIIVGILLFGYGCSNNSSNSITDPSNNPDIGINLRSSSDHFHYYSAVSDTSVIDTLSILLESNLTRLINTFNVQVIDSIKVYIYPSFETFHAAAERAYNSTPPDLLTGFCLDKYEFRIISPLSAEPVNNYGEILLVGVHESIHAFYFQEFESNFSRIIKWLFEGFATYEAQQFVSRTIIRQRINENTLPTLMQLRENNYFNSNYGYHFSHTAVEYIVDEYGYESLEIILRDPDRFEDAFGLGVTEEVLNDEWHDYLRANY